MNKIVLAVAQKPFPAYLEEWKELFQSLDTELISAQPSELFSILLAKNIDSAILLLPYMRESFANIASYFFHSKNKQTPLFQWIDSDEKIKENLLAESKIAGFLFAPMNLNKAQVLEREAQILREQKSKSKELIFEIMKYREQKSKLLQIGTALSAQHDLNALLDLILLESRHLVNADAGSVYIREGKEKKAGEIYSEKSEHIIFKVSQNDSVQMTEKSKEYSIRIGPGTIAGYVAFTNDILEIDDVYCIPEDAPYKFGKAFDERFSYRTKSMLTVPLENRNGEIVGVLQLINKKVKSFPPSADKKNEEIISFGPNDKEIILALASQAAVAIEKAQLYQDIENLFKGFVESSVAAIEARDKPTSGHSKRVQAYALRMAQLINEKKDGPFKDIYFDTRALKELEYAALLHDVGKIGVREAVLTKPTRLSKEKMETVENRWRYALLLEAKTNQAWQEYDQRKKQLEEDLLFLQQINKSTFLDDQKKSRLDQIKNQFYNTESGEKRPFLTEEEYEHLSIRKGNLTESERLMINYHAESTRQILSNMPWTRDLDGVTNIACHHHERLNGTGYPDKLQGDQIPLQSRILSLIDIFEALVAQDRPYKPPIPTEKALAILRDEAAQNHIDPELLSIFVNEKVYEIFSLESLPAKS